MNQLLEVDSIQLQFNHQSILTDIYLRVQSSEIVGLLGRNGSGKSSLFSLIFGTLTASQQSIRLNGKPVKHLYQQRKTINYLPQRPFLPKNFTVQKAIHLCLPERALREAIESEESVQKILYTRLGDVSGGERRFLEVLLILHADTQFSLLDEPFASLSPIQIEKVKKLIQQQARTKGIMISDHSYEHVMEISHQLVLLHNGTTRTITDRQMLYDLGYLSVPSPSVETRTTASEYTLFTPGQAWSVDAQSLRDLAIFPSDSQENNVLDWLDHTRTRGGKECLRTFLKSPRADTAEINFIQDTLRYVSANMAAWIIELTDEDMLSLERYLDANYTPVSTENKPALLFAGFWYWAQYTSSYRTIVLAITQMRIFFSKLREFSSRHSSAALPAGLQAYYQSIKRLLNDARIQEFISDKADSFPFYVKPLYYDRLFRTRLRDTITALLDVVYQLDALVSLAKSIHAYQLSFPAIIFQGEETLQINGIYHPFVQKPVPNDITFYTGENFLFLTGPNMAGKTTFMKAYGICLYLAHLGMAIPASSMRFSPYHGIFTSINTTDNLSAGYSYFYSEVRRVKEVALRLKKGEKLLVIFDELFKGTNVKDAYDGSRLVIEGFSAWPDSLFILSSHLTELAADIESFPNIFFRYFESSVREGKPSFSYRMKEGVSHERLGLLILKNEQIDTILTPTLITLPDPGQVTDRFGKKD